MELMTWGLLGLSFAANIFLFYRRLRPKKQTPKLDIGAQDLLHDLTARGQAILRVEVIDPANFLLRSPRQ